MILYFGYFILFCVLDASYASSHLQISHRCIKMRALLRLLKNQKRNKKNEDTRVHDAIAHLNNDKTWRNYSAKRQVESQRFSSDHQTNFHEVEKRRSHNLSCSRFAQEGFSLTGVWRSRRSMETLARSRKHVSSQEIVRTVLSGRRSRGDLPETLSSLFHTLRVIVHFVTCLLRNWCFPCNNFVNCVARRQR